MHAQQRGKIFPFIFGFLPKKTEATYIRFYREVFNRVRWQGNNPDDILVDYERAAINAMHHQNQHMGQSIQEWTK